ncbi:MFS transporter [Reinekea blandensis]|uniref:Major facilitator superfamily (MFS) profile domain-containing protein n=1 Tax=Reinekea blandensis MED297 TaxID=314283 RepID=A4BFI3_9GAMM|nr:MFS transporter [Reinekea blandensis]EAR09078.1 hypothetical protein MED297_17088 [Reinekea sp. MED297] [Reinekea blandensis MED297]
MPPGQPWQRNLTLMNVISFARTFLIIMPVFVPLMESYGLNMQQTMLLQSVFAGTTLILELPSGYVADVFGRKNTLMVGYLLAGAGFSQIVWAETFWSLVLFEFTLGCAMSLVSGSDTALVFESEKALSSEQNYGAIGRMLSWMNFGEGTAALCAFFLVAWDLRLILWVQAIVGWVPFILSFALTEPARSDQIELKRTTHGAWRAFRLSPVTLLVTLVFVACMSTTYLATWLNQSLWQRHQLPLETFGLIWGLFSMTVAIASRYSDRLPTRLAGFGAFGLLSIVVTIAWVALISRSLAIIIAGGFLMAVFRGLVAPRLKVAINQSIDNVYRATVNSIVASFFRIATFFLGPLMGMAVDIYDADVAAMFLVVLIVPAILGLWYLDQYLETSSAQNS